MKKQTDTFKRLRAAIKDINGDNRQIIKTMQDQIDYLMEFIAIQGEILEEKTGSCQPELSIEQKKRLAHRGKKLNEFLLGQSEEIVKEVLRLANSNPTWGYDRIAGVMKYLGYDVSATTVRNVLDAHGIVPDPERRRRGDWLQFFETQQYVTAATDFAHVEMATEYGLERRHLLFFMDIGS